MQQPRAILLAIVLVCAGCASGLRPSTAEMDALRHGAAANGRAGYVGHCTRIEDLRCERAAGSSGTLQCTYREWAPTKPWPLKTARIVRGDREWVWLSGDAPRCTNLYLD